MKLYVQTENGTYREATIDEAVAGTRRKLRQKFRRGKAIRSPADTEAFLIAELGNDAHETFCVMHLDTRHRLLGFDRLFRGTIDGTSVYPREVVKRSLELNTAALILAHGHPSGSAEPSQADQRITRRLKAALELVDIRCLDHMIVGADRCVSLAARGLI